MTIALPRLAVLNSLIAALLLSIALPLPSSAFNGHIVQEGPLTLSIDPVDDVRQFDQAHTVTARIGNAGSTAVDVDLQMDGLVDEWYAVGASTATLAVQPGQTQATTFRIAAGRGAVSALYPVHVYARFRDRGQEAVAHAVQVFASNFEQTATSTAVPPTLPVNTLPVRGALPLWSLRTHRMAWQYHTGPLVYMPAGWSGTSEESSASLFFGSVTRGATRDAIIMHPPWKPGGGTIFIEYRLALPPTGPITLTFANAIRDHSAGEPPSDGVTFRVWVDDHTIFSRHTDSKRWVEGEVDLSDWAGQEILLRLESHPGPQHNTTCDSSYWGNPIVVSGEMPEPISPAQRDRLWDTARALVAQDSGQGAVLRLDGAYRAAVVAGNAGLFDAAIAVGNADASVVFDGLRISVLGHPIGRGPSGVNLAGEANWTARDRELVARQPLLLGDEQFTLTVRMWPDKTGLRIEAECPKRITDFAIGSADQRAPRVYYGHGYCIVEPEAFRAGFGGHNLSTSHVGFDFERGLSLLVATDNPPDYLEVDPESQTYALHTHMNGTMTLVPSTRGAFDCALKYRDLYDKQPSPDFERKAGRFVFDIWGGRYAEIAQKMQQMVDYGLTDSLLTVHVWQRWGYDYRLPDIYPPDPALGTIEDMRQIAVVCDAHDIPWGLHDNYIDFYPDAEGYSYDHICFTESGQPVRAWINEGRNAQSYRWRPDHIMPFVRQNLKQIGPALHPTHYFIDVFTSIDCFDYYDKQGHFHSMLETRRHWGEAFAWIRRDLGGNAVMTSEAGHDQLVGYLAGADCQFLQLSPESREFCIHLACEDWQRVPWYDAVLHDKFSLHGVGYSGRYQGGRSRAEHGIESDDCISAEILTGHASMIDNPGFGRGAIRKYWLAQDFTRSIAHDTIASAEFVGGDIHRQIVDWTGGARVYVNRGGTDWTVAGKVLPPYGYYARSGAIESSIERIDGAVVEQSRGPSRWYFSARGFGPEGQLAIRPHAERVEYLGGRQFKLIMTWQADEPAPKDLQVFIHFVSETSDRSDKIAFQGGSQPPQPTSQWQGAIRLGEDRTVTIPSAYGPSEYEILVGLWDPATGQRYGLLGDDDGTMRYRIGTLVVQGRGQEVRSVALAPHEAAHANPGWSAGIGSIDFGPAATRGAFRCTRNADTLVVTPLPNLRSFPVALRPTEFGFDGARVRSLVAIDVDGQPLRPVGYETDNDRIAFETQRNEFAYIIHMD